MPFWDGYLTYLQLKPGTEWKAMEAKIPAIMKQTYDEETSESVVFYLQPFEDIHLTSDLLFETETPGDKSSVYFLMIIGALVLFIAWFNYINLSTARSELRAKEVGIRKVVGSSRGSLIRQFLVEASLVNVLAMLIAISLTQLLTPMFNNLIDRSIPMSIFSDPRLLIALVAVFAVGTLLTGLYPAFLLSSYEPITTLKSGPSESKIGNGRWLQKSLVTLQFMTSIALIACTMIIYYQLGYMQKTELGVNISKTLVLKRPLIIDSTFQAKAETLKNQIERLASVENVIGSTSVPGAPFSYTAGISKWSEDEFFGLHAMAADFDFSQSYGIEMAAGRPLSKDRGNDHNSCILNELSAQVFGFEKAEEALGMEVNFWGDKLTVVGVVKNFHQESPKSKMEPMILRSLNENYNPKYFSVKLASANAQQLLGEIEVIWTNVFGKEPLDYFFLDEKYDNQYKSEYLFGKVFSVFAGLAIFVSCLGLFALIAFVAERKKKEIGIRKVLGASVSNIVIMLSKDFISLVIIALVVAVPITWYFMNGWLSNFANRITIGPSAFLIAGLAAIIIAFVTISIQSTKAAMANPVESLRSE